VIHENVTGTRILPPSDMITSAREFWIFSTSTALPRRKLDLLTGLKCRQTYCQRILLSTDTNRKKESNMTNLNKDTQNSEMHPPYSSYHNCSSSYQASFYWQLVPPQSGASSQGPLAAPPHPIPRLAPPHAAFPPSHVQLARMYNLHRRVSSSCRH
jgi:hypothetical protein